MFVPPVSGDDFMSLIANMDVMLDTPHFGSGNTFYESMVYGIPIITWPGRFMRGRLVGGFYLWLGITDAPIAKSLDDYARISVELATNSQRLGALKQQLLNKVSVVFRDEQAVREFECFLLEAVDQHRHNKNPHHWVSPHEWPGRRLL